MPQKSKTLDSQQSSLKALAAQKAGVLHADDSVETAGERMRKHEAKTWPVVEAGAKLVGMVKQKNPDWTAAGHGHDPKGGLVGQIMSREAVFCYEDDDCAKAQKLMVEHDLEYLPVVDHEMHIIGIFSRKEIAETVQEDATHQRVARRAMELARQDGRVAFTDDDFARAAAELIPGAGSE